MHLDDLELVYCVHDREVRHPLRDGHTRIGRRSRCELSPPGKGVSKIHAFIERHGDSVVLEDAHSRNGTFVNDRRIVRTEIKAGDRIRVGSCELYLVFAGAPIPEEQPRRREPVVTLSSLVIAAFLTACVGLAAYGALRLVGVERPRELEAATVVDELTAEEAFDKGTCAYLRGELAEAQRYLRLASGPSVDPLLEVIAAELAALRKPVDAVDWQARGVLLRRLLLSDPPAELKARAKRQLEAIDRGGAPAPPGAGSAPRTAAQLGS